MKLKDVRDICFAADTTLGKLARWMRLLGFDTKYLSAVSAKRFIQCVEKERILLTRTNLIRDQSLDRKLVFITSNNPFEQVKEVIRSIGIAPEDIRPFSRCTRCNVLTQQVGRDAVHDRVPEYVWETHIEFKICRRCRRIYWPGSHIQRSYDIIEQIFETGNSSLSS